MVPYLRNLQNKYEWNSDKHNCFFQENAFEYTVCNMSSVI